jgi:sugar phosphate isomerase/epimerase
METGQETPETLAAFLRKLGHKNVGVNLDPANIILYDKGNPVAAIKTLGPWLKQCHIKDAVRTKVAGQWGQEVVLGTGQVDWKAFFAALQAVNFTGNLCIEREAGNQRVADVRTAREYLERQIVNELGEREYEGMRLFLRYAGESGMLVTTGGAQA